MAVKLMLIPLLMVLLCRMAGSTAPTASNKQPSKGHEVPVNESLAVVQPEPGWTSWLDKLVVTLWRVIWIIRYTVQS